MDGRIEEKHEESTNLHRTAAKRSYVGSTETMN